MATPAFLADLPIQYRNGAWVAAQSDELYQYINDGLQQADTIDAATDALLLIYPRLMALDDLKTWHKLIEKALRKAVDARPRRSSRNGQDTYIIGDGYIIERLDHSATEIMPKTRRRPRFRLNPRKLLEDYLILLTSLLYRPGSKLQLGNDRINDLLEFSRRVNDPHTAHKTYQTLAFIYNRQGKFSHARMHAELAFNYFAVEDNLLEAGLSAFAIAQACAAPPPPHLDIDAARDWLRRASGYLSRTEYIGQYGMIPLLEAKLNMGQGRLPEMVSAGELALDELMMMNMQGERGKYFKASAHYMVGAGNSMQKQFDAAYKNFDTAMKLWEEIENGLRYEESSLAVAFTLALQGDTAAALERRQASVDALEAMPESGHRDHLLGYAKMLKKHIDEGTVEKLIPPRQD